MVGHRPLEASILVRVQVRQQTKPMKLNLIIIDGPIGAGKSTVAKLLHKKLKRTALLSLDRIKWLVSDFKPVRNDLQLASDIGKAMTKEYFKNKINVIVEKAFTRKEFVENFTKLKRNKKINIFVYQIETPLETAIRRVAKRAYPPYIKVKKRPSPAKIKRNHKNYSLYKYGKATVFNSIKLNPRQIVKEILKEIKSS